MTNIYVGNLSYQVTEDEVRSMFQAYGPVNRVRLITDRVTGKPKGFGFVEMRADADTARAIAGLNGKQVDGRALNVNEAREKADRGFGTGGGKRRSDRW